MSDPIVLHRTQNDGINIGNIFIGGRWTLERLGSVLFSLRIVQFIYGAISLQRIARGTSGHYSSKNI